MISKEAKIMLKENNMIILNSPEKCRRNGQKVVEGKSQYLIIL